MMHTDITFFALPNSKLIYPPLSLCPSMGEKTFLTLDDVEVSGSTVFVRVDVNSPIDPRYGAILDDSRFRSHIPTLEDLHDAAVVILAHQSRPGKDDFTTTEPHAREFARLLRRRVEYVDGLLESHVIDRVENIQPGQVLMLQNVRFYSEEVAVKGKKPEDFEHTHIVRRLSPYMDYFVNDAFAAAHRAQTTLIGFALQVPMLAGRLMEKEITALERFMRADERPKVAVLGGAKVDDSLKLMENMLRSGSLDAVLTGGLVAQVFLLASGVDVGEGSVAYLRREFDDLETLINRARALLDDHGERIQMPDDVALDRDGQRVTVGVGELPSEYPVYDIGIETIVKYSRMLSEARMAFINGPMGVYEIPEFSAGTEEVLRAFRNVRGLRLAGGGHTISAIRMYGLEENFDHISVGGGSLMAFLSGERLPVIEALHRSYQKFRGGSI